MVSEENAIGRRVVYTILLGGYECLKPQPALLESEIDRYCFTDDPSLTSNDWTVVLVKPVLPGDVVRSQREIKSRVHRYLAEYDASLYIDNTVSLRVRPEVIIDEWLRDADLALAQHSFRETLLEEFDEVVRLNYDDVVRVHEQLMDYARTLPEVLESKPLWTGMIARRHNTQVCEAMEAWFTHISRYSRRDQLSVRYALSTSKLRILELQHDNFESIWHTWSVDPSRKIAQGKRPAMPSGPLLADLLRLESENIDLRGRATQLAERVLELEQFEDQATKVANLTNLVQLREKQLVELTSSSSWRVTAPIRRIFNLFARR